MPGQQQKPSSDQPAAPAPSLAPPAPTTSNAQAQAALPPQDNGFTSMLPTLLGIAGGGALALATRGRATGPLRQAATAGAGALFGGAAARTGEMAHHTATHPPSSAAPPAPSDSAAPSASPGPRHTMATGWFTGTSGARDNATSLEERMGLPPQSMATFSDGNPFSAVGYKLGLQSPMSTALGEQMAADTMNGQESMTHAHSQGAMATSAALRHASAIVAAQNGTTPDDGMRSVTDLATTVSSGPAAFMPPVPPAADGSEPRTAHHLLRQTADPFRDSDIVPAINGLEGQAPPGTERHDMPSSAGFLGSLFGLTPHPFGQYADNHAKVANEALAGGPKKPPPSDPAPPPPTCRGWGNDDKNQGPPDPGGSGGGFLGGLAQQLGIV